MSRVLRTLKANERLRFALATVIALEGSSYRRPGAKMLFGEDGSRHGSVSAGCLEEDLAHHAPDVIRSGRPQTLTYDLRAEDDLSWGRGAGCNGIVTVHVEPCEWSDRASSDGEPLWPRLEALLDSGRRVASVKRLGLDGEIIVDGEAGASGLSGNGLFCADDGFVFGDSDRLFCADNGFVFGDSDRLPSEEAVPRLRRCLAGGVSARLEAGAGADGAAWLFERYEPRERLYIFGAGPDAEPVARLAGEMDFRVAVVAPESGRCNARYFPTADERIVEHPESFLHDRNLPDDSYVIVMTHDFTRDRHILRRLLNAPLRYLGVLGPRSRTERLLFPEPLPARLYSPIGMSIGAAGPEEIAVSIVAELLKVRHERSGPR